MESPPSPSTPPTVLVNNSSSRHKCPLNFHWLIHFGGQAPAVISSF